MIKLPQVTLISVSTRNVEKAADALYYSCRGIEFGEVKLLSQYKPHNLSENYTWGFIDEMETIDNWNYFMVYELWKHIDTEFAFIVHPDGFIVHPESWDDKFLEYDYIGAAWPVVPPHYTDPISNEIVRVGNSVSIRSKKIMKLPTDINMPWELFEGNYNEDTQITVANRTLLLSHGIKYAPLELAVHFSHETLLPEMEGIKPLAFHRYHKQGHPNFNYPRL